MSELYTIEAEKYCDSVRDGTHDTPKQVDKGYKLVTAKHINNGQIDLSDAYLISEKDYIKICERSKVEKWDVLMSMIGNGLGKSAVVKDNPEYAIKNLALFKIGDEVKAKWLHYYLSSKAGQGYIYNSLQGSGQPFISLSVLRKFPIPVPDNESTMRDIVKILSRYDSLIENYQKQIKLLEEAAQRLYKEWFVDLHFPGHENTKIVDGVPEGWEKKRLVDIVDVQYGYAFDGKLFNSNGEGMPILRIRNIPDGITSDYTTEEAQDCYIVHNGDIVVGMDGIFHINSWSGGDAFLVQRACSFRPQKDGMKGLIFQAIQEPIKFFEKTLVGATVAHLGKKHIDSIELCIPKDMDLYRPFSKQYEQRQILLSQIRFLTEARDRLLPKLMSGEIEV
ncbi:MAG: restriction endonuclease subunit S [Prevotella sp.]|nr:restriction endonuclease subunit S [Prevotella sp.]